MVDLHATPKCTRRSRKRPGEIHVNFPFVLGLLRHVQRIHSRPLREDAFRGSVRQLVRLGHGLAGDLVVVDIEPVAQVRVL